MASLELIAKWNGKEYVVTTPVDATIKDLKRQLEAFTKVQAKRQKLVGLAAGKLLADETILSHCKLKQKHKFIMVGTPEDELAVFVTPSQEQEVFDDFDLEYVPSLKDIEQNINNRTKLKHIIEKASIQLIHPPRPGKKLLVLDLDYTILDCQNISERDSLHDYKRPHLDEFMAGCYANYDIVVWSQTSWRWLEVKLTEMGLLTNPNFRISFVLDRTFMFPVVSKHNSKEHEVKALEIIWSQFPHWNKKKYYSCG